MAGEGQHTNEMNSDDMNPDDLRHLERELRALVPRAPSTDLAKLMYRAGQASLSPLPPIAPLAVAPVDRGQWLWPASTAVTGTLAAWLAVMLIIAYNRPSFPDAPTRSVVHPHPLPPPVAVQEMAPAAPQIPAPRPTMTAENATYIRDRDTALQHGVDALSHPAAPALAGEGTSATRVVPSAALRRELGITRPVRGGWKWPW
jgi:hypothetical protein